MTNHTTINTLSKTYGFDKSQRSTFKYWFAHWCAFQMVALNLHVWKPKYLFHDIWKPWLRLFLPYEKVQQIHRLYSNHHIEYLKKHQDINKLDIEAMIIDNECSRYTKNDAPLTAIQYIRQERRKLVNHILDIPIECNVAMLLKVYTMARITAYELGLLKMCQRRGELVKTHKYRK